MKLSGKYLSDYNDNGYILLENALSSDDVSELLRACDEVFCQDRPERILETHSNAVRSIYAPHAFHETFKRLADHVLVVGPAAQILEDEVYIYQYKINAKLAFDGEIWEWHQDYIFWLNEDGMPQPRAINVCVLLDEVHEFNGPMIFLPGSQREGVIDETRMNESQNPLAGNEGWKSNVSAKLTYALNRQTVARLVTRYGMVAPKGAAGSILLFHPNVVHSSAPNMSPFNRRIVMVTFNSMSNPLPDQHNPRPSFLAARNAPPARPLYDSLSPSAQGAG